MYACAARIAARTGPTKLNLAAACGAWLAAAAVGGRLGARGCARSGEDDAGLCTRGACPGRRGGADAPHCAPRTLPSWAGVDALQSPANCLRRGHCWPPTSRARNRRERPPPPRRRRAWPRSIPQRPHRPRPSAAVPLACQSPCRFPSAVATRGTNFTTRQLRRSGSPARSEARPRCMLGPGLVGVRVVVIRRAGRPPCPWPSRSARRCRRSCRWWRAASRRRRRRATSSRHPRRARRPRTAGAGWGTARSAPW